MMKHAPLALADNLLPLCTCLCSVGSTNDQHLDTEQLSQDTEEESEDSSTFPRTRHRLSLQQPSLQHSNPEEQVDAYIPMEVCPVDGEHGTGTISPLPTGPRGQAQGQVA